MMRTSFSRPRTGGPAVDVHREVAFGVDGQDGSLHIKHVWKLADCLQHERRQNLRGLAGANRSEHEHVATGATLRQCQPFGTAVFAVLPILGAPSPDNEVVGVLEP